MLLRHGVLLAAALITVIYLLGLTAALTGAPIDDNLLSTGRTVIIIAWIGWFGVAVRDSVIEHQRAMSRIRRPER